MAFRRSASSQQQQQLLPLGQGQSQSQSQSPYYTTPIFDTAIVRRDYAPSRIEDSIAGGVSQYQTAPSIKQEDATMPGKRTASGEPDGTPVKQPKTERPEEFSKQVRTKLQGSSRTGQACDRCKVCIDVDSMPLCPSTAGVSRLC
jgi:hypothetical protein